MPLLAFACYLTTTGLPDGTVCEGVGAGTAKGTEGTERPGPFGPLDTVTKT